MRSMRARARRWRVPLSTFDSFVSTVADGVVYLYSANQSLGYSVDALDAQTGALRWRFPMGGNAPSLAVVVADGTVFFGSWGGTVDGLDASTGKPRWQVPVHGNT
jgi:outer membrane protein assembly factor BamB